MLTNICRQARFVASPRGFAKTTTFHRCKEDYSTEKPVSLVGRDFLTLRDFTKTEIQQLLWTSLCLKDRIKNKKEIFQPLIGKSVSMIFQKRSTRTRLSTESGMVLLGGHAAFLGPSDVHLGVNETIRDSARVLSRMTDIILARVYAHSDVEELADEASVPVISGLSDMFHPLQCLADFVTLQEHYGYLYGLKIAYVGDGNNILHSLMYGCAKLGIDLSIATPTGYEPDPDVTQEVIKMYKQKKTQFCMTSDPLEAVYRADVIVTDTWVSMGQEEEKTKRLKDFAGYQIDRNMLKEANANWTFLHCLPRKQEEVTDDIFNDKNSLVWQEAENRKWTVMAVMLHVLQDYSPLLPKPKFVRGE
ncbi:ornithine transcarbamylase, mitochondrial [Patella vulgata]|uniref:ornithine transcarbamylase, mitochondrial n=1 Tax=Patella vulgata TaxID=6465 RepID=UPI00218069DD|nr:ornithine transcarbamylase, mitochondrial [Patella vulgata]